MTCALEFIASVDKIQSQPRCSTTYELDYEDMIEAKWNTMQLQGSIKVMKFSSTWLELRDIMLSQVIGMKKKDKIMQSHIFLEYRIINQDMHFSKKRLLRSPSKNTQY